MKSLMIAVTLIVAVLTGGAAFGIDALEIVMEGDKVLNAPEDAHINLTMKLIDKKGNTSERKSEMYQKGADKRLIRFLTPADQKGIGFLTLPVMSCMFTCLLLKKSGRLPPMSKTRTLPGPT